MFQALAPRMPRGFSWARPAIAGIALSLASPLASAQAPPAPKPAPTKAEAPPASKLARPPKPEASEGSGPTAEVFLDPNAKKALTKFEPLTFPPGAPIRTGPNSPDTSTIQNMAVGVVATDANFLKRYVEFFAVELSKRDNINAVIDPPKNQRPESARGMERAVESLIDPMTRARANGKADFLATYTRILFESSLVKLLDGNLFSRIDAMIVLGSSGSTAPNALALYTDQIKKVDQVVWVKQWAARGLINATRQGRDNLEANRTLLAAEALVGLLDSDPKLPWPVQMRALEALGCLRMAWNNVRTKVDAASVAMRFLADTEAKPEVRAWAAWALGMMKVPPQVTPYNFELLGLKFGELAVEIGRKIVREFDENAANFDREKDRASQLTGLLVFEVYPGISGQDGVTESGLLRSTHPGLASDKTARPFLTKLDARVKDVAREAYELLRAGGTAQKPKRDDLEARINDLKALLAQVNPKTATSSPAGRSSPRSRMPPGWPVPGSPERGGDPESPSLAIPEIRDYQRINAELVGLLDRGHARVRLEGAEGQRLLLAGLAGAWRAVVEVEGRTGPELAAGLDAPNLVVVARGPTLDGAGRGLRAGTLAILGGVGDALGYAQSGGLIVVVGPAGHRAGLAQSGGTLAVLGSTGRLPADRQSGGRFFVEAGRAGPHPGRGRRGGRLIEVPCAEGLAPGDAESWAEAEAVASRWGAPPGPTRP